MRYFNSDSSDEEPLSGSTKGLLIKSAPNSRFLYWPNQMPIDLAIDDSSTTSPA
jgi:hypothetical protein